MLLPQELEESLNVFPDGLGRRWAADLPHRLEAAEERWGIQIGPAFQPGGVASFAAPAVSRDGEQLVYKITVPHVEAVGEAEALALYDGEGAVRVVASEAPTMELLLERAVPGSDLWSVPSDSERLNIASTLMRRLWRRADDDRIARVEDVARLWADITERRLVTADLPWVGDPIERGVELLRSLPDEPHDEVLVHGDFHPGNILAAEREAWLAIDPKPMIGDPAFEPVQLLTQRRGRIAEPPDVAGVERRLERIAGLVGLEADLVGRWAIARTSEWSMWSWEHGDTIDAAIAYTWSRTLGVIV